MDDETTIVELEPTDEAHDALIAAAEWAESVFSPLVGVEHLILGMFAPETFDGTLRPRNFAVRICQSLGIERLDHLVLDVINDLERFPAPSAELVVHFSDFVADRLVEATHLAGEGPLDTPDILRSLLSYEPTPHPALHLLLDAGVTTAAIARVQKAMSFDTDEIDATIAAMTGEDEDVDAEVPDPSVDLTDAARAGRLDPVIGREAEIAQVIKILARRRKNNPVLLGEAGVGKTAIVEGLAQMIVAGNVPDVLKNKRVLVLVPASLVAGAAYRGQFEQKVLALIERLKTDRDTILFIDEMHTVVGAGATGEGGDLANLLKPALARGEIQTIGATTLDEYRIYIEKDAALERRLQPVAVEEPSETVTRQILTGLVDRYAAHHHVTYAPAALDACVTLAGKHLVNRRFPDKAIDLMDDAGAATSLAGRKKVDASAVRRECAIRLGDPTSLDEAATPLTDLGSEIVGQPAVTASVEQTIAVRTLGLTPRRGPLATFVLTGPTGTGKSALAEALAKRLFRGALTTIDLGEYAEAHAVSGLIGSPPGYVGYDEPARLVEPLRRSQARVVLLRHADLAHPIIRALLADAVRTGEIRDTHGRIASLRDAIVILTVTDQSEAAKILGFGASRSTTAKDTRAKAIAAIGPTLVDLADEVLAFVRLDAAALGLLVGRRLDAIAAALAERGVVAAFSDTLRRRLVMDSSAGASAITRAIERLVERPLATYLAANRASSSIRVDLDQAGAVVIDRLPSLMPVRPRRVRATQRVRAAA